MKRSLVTLLFASLLMLPYASGAQASPMSFLKQTQAKLNALAKANATDAQLKAAVNKLLDFEFMAQRTLQAHWASLTADQRSRFTKTFRRLLEKNYIKGLRKRKNYTVVYKSQSSSGGMAKVSTEVKYVRKGRQRSNEIVYRLRRSGGRWVIFDVIVDDVSMENNYKRSFGKIMKKSGFDVLLSKLKKKVARN